MPERGSSAAHSDIRSIVRSGDHRDQLGQLRPANTNTASIYTPGASNLLGVITMIVVANTSVAGVTYRLFHHKTGSTFDQSTALVYDATQGANSSSFLVFPEDNAITVRFGGNLGIRSGTANDLTFTVYGFEASLV